MLAPITLIHVSVLRLDLLSLVSVAVPGDQIAGMLAVAVASSRTLEVLDLEGTGLTNQSAQVCNVNITIINTTIE